MPSLRLIAGPNGSGKTTLTQLLREDYAVPLGQYLNPDDIAKHIKASDQFTGNSSSAEKLAQQVAVGLRDDWVRNDLSFTYESVMSHESHIEFARQAQGSGYKAYLYYVCVSDAELNKERVAQRVQEGGHDVPEDKIISRYQRSLDNLYTMLDICRRGFLFDNSTDDMVLLAEVTKDGYLDINEAAYILTQPYWFETAVLSKWDQNKVRIIS